MFAAAAEVERWPTILPHYRWVTVRKRQSPHNLVVEMAAWRPFGPARWPTWWVSDMQIDAIARTIRYTHVEGITRGMDVEWNVVPTGDGCDVSIVHEWEGPSWPVIGPPAASLIIGPVFIHGIASRTLAGLARHVTDSNLEMSNL